MLRHMLIGKIHRAKVTQCELHYEGSCAIDDVLLEASGIREFERIDIWNINNGARLSTYAIRAQANSGTVSLNGSAARYAQVGDRIIIAAFGQLNSEELGAFQPKLVFVDERNQIIEKRSHVPVQR